MNIPLMVISAFIGCAVGMICFAMCRASNDPPAPKSGIAKFDKVSFGQFHKDWLSTFHPDFDNESDDRKYTILNSIDAAYEAITTPVRSTKGSAGYDFVSPLSFTLRPGDEIKIPLGIRCEMDNKYVLCIFPRSSIGFKYRVMLNNTTGIVDSDYFFSDNEGHIHLKIANMGNKILEVKVGDKICQGIFLKYGITEDDNVTETRNGGFGSTGK